MNYAYIRISTDKQTVKNQKYEILNYCDKKKFQIDFGEYSGSTFKYHKEIILDQLGYISFKDFKHNFQFEANELVQTSLKPKHIVYKLASILVEKKIEMPFYNTYAKAITTALNSFENTLLQELIKNLTNEQKMVLDEIIKLSKNIDQPLSPHNPYLITTIKKPIQATTPRKISESLKDFSIVSDLFMQFKNIIEKLNISEQLLNYYAVWMIKIKYSAFLSIKDSSRQYLYLLSFIIYQYRIRQDLFVKTFLQAIQKYHNQTEKSIIENLLNQNPTE
ncbi:recombinase family protein [Bacteroidota bacterium]